MTLLKGALVAFTPTFVAPVPNITVFQYNPETLTHTWKQPRPQGSGPAVGNPQAVPGMPSEDFSLTVIFDSNQDIEDDVPISAELAKVSGVYTRLSALEMLLYPAASSGTAQLLGQATAAAQQVAGGDKGASATVPASTTPFAIFVWGLYRIVPVRLTALTVTEKLYDAFLNPTHAEALLELEVLTPADLKGATGANAVLAKLATVAYLYTLGVRQAGALANLGNAGMTGAGMF